MHPKIAQNANFTRHFHSGYQLQVLRRRLWLARLTLCKALVFAGTCTLLLYQPCDNEKLARQGMSRDSSVAPHWRIGSAYRHFVFDQFSQFQRTVGFLARVHQPAAKHDICGPDSFANIGYGRVLHYCCRCPFIFRNSPMPEVGFGELVLSTTNTRHAFSPSPHSARTAVLVISASTDPV